MKSKMVAFAIILANCTVFGGSSIEQGDTLSCVELEGFRNARHAQRCVGSCEGNSRAVIFYSTPSDRKIVENATACINDLKENRAGPLVYYVVNKKSVTIPAMFLRNMLKDRSKKYPDITYCIDYEEKLPTIWKLGPRHAYIIVLDKSGIVLFGAILPFKQNECKELKDILFDAP